MANVNMMELDFTGVTSLNLIPEGVHTVTVSEAEFSRASTGSDQLVVTFETADGATRKSWYNLQPQALWKVKGFLEVLGIPCEGRIKLNTRTIVGRSCQITVEPDDNDDTKLIISRVSKLENAPVEVPYAAQPQMPIQESAPVTQAPPVEPAQESSGNLPPWMRNSAPAGTAVPPQGNLPPWMKK